MSEQAAIHLAVKLDNIKYCSTNQQLPSRNRENNGYSETTTSDLPLLIICCSRINPSLLFRSCHNREASSDELLS
jgi:hypothetical protein